MEYQNIRNKLIAVPTRQVVNKAGEISSTVEDTTAWPDENGLKIKDGKLALSTSSSTTVTNAQSLYPQLWANSPAGWKSGSDLVVPAMGNVEQVEATFTANWVVGTNTSAASHILASATKNGKKVTVKGQFSTTVVATGTPSIIKFPYSDLPFGIAGYLTGQTYRGGNPSDDNSGHLYNISGNVHATFKSTTLATNTAYTYTFSYETSDENTTSTTPMLYLFDNILSSSIGLPTADKETKGLVSYTDINQVLENECINGSFDFNQRGSASYTLTDEYTLDRFVPFHGNSTTNTITQQQFTKGQTDVDGNPNNYIRAVVASGSLANSFSSIVTRLENLAKYSGEWVTVGVDLKADAAKDISFEFSYRYGTGGSPSTNETGIGVNKISITDTWDRYYFTVQLPSVSGKTFGTDNNDSLELKTWFDAGSDYDARTNSLGNQSGTFEIANLDIKRTRHQTPFTRAGGSYAGELALCQRYFYDYLVPSSGCAGTGHLWTSTNYRINITIPERFRTTPSVSSTGTFNVYGSGGATSSATYSGTTYNSDLSASITSIWIAGASVGTIGSLVASGTGHIYFDCEL